MAARENQGMQIALIIFVMITVVLLVLTYFLFRKWTELETANKDLTTKKSEADTAANKATQEANEIKTMIGAASTDKLEGEGGITDATGKDMDKYGKTLPADKRNYRALVAFLATELSGANTRIAEVTAQEKELADKIEADEEAKAAEIAEYKGTAEKHEKDLAAERAKFIADRKDLTDSKADILKRFNESQKEQTSAKTKSAAQIADLAADNTRLNSLIQGINEREAEKKKLAEVPDGKITFVNQRTRVVWINLGIQDGLRRQTTFSVYDRDRSNPADAPSKGKIEVVNLLQSHMAEARIVEDDLSQPLMPGDLIFSPAWEPGQPEHFALAGRIDFDNDGEDDSQRVRDMITQNGGVIDAEVTEDGKRVGQMTINTKYLVKGEPPKIGKAADDKNSSIANYSAIIKEAGTLGVQPLKVTDFVKYMGYKAEDRTVKLGKMAKPSDFKPRLPEGVQRIVPGTTPARDPRRPVPPVVKSAY